MPCVDEVKKHVFQKLLEANIEISEARKEVDLILEYCSGFSLTQQVLQADVLLNQKVLDCIEALLEQRSKRIPLQYCLGYADFAGMKLIVRPGVLIPRCDTECLVQIAIGMLSKLPDLTIADIGTGSGAIAIALAKKLPKLKVVAIDLSDEALQVAQENIHKYSVDNQVQLIAGNWKDVLPKNLDAIVSNPPYLNELDILAPEIKHEPVVALFGEDPDGLKFYRELAGSGSNHLKPGGKILVEVKDGTSQQVVQIFEKAGWLSVCQHKDINNLPRVVTAQSPQ